MGDLLVKLYALDFSDLSERERELEKEHRARIVRVMSPNFDRVKRFITEEFGGGWASEATAAFYRTPVSCFAAVNGEREIVGFACYTPPRSAFSARTWRKTLQWSEKGVGRAAFLRCMQSMWKDQATPLAIIVRRGTRCYKYYIKNLAKAEPIPTRLPRGTRGLI